MIKINYKISEELMKHNYFSNNIYDLIKDIIFYVGDASSWDVSAIESDYTNGTILILKNISPLYIKAGYADYKYYSYTKLTEKQIFQLLKLKVFL